MFCKALQRRNMHNCGLGQTELSRVVSLLRYLILVFLREFNLDIPELFVYTITYALIYIPRKDFFFFFFITKA